MTAALKDQRIRVLERHLGRLSTVQNRLIQLDQRFFWLRLSVLLGGTFLSAGFLFFGPPGWGIRMTLLSILAFTGVVFFHRRVDRARLKFASACAFTESLLARARLEWDKIPDSFPPSLTSLSPSHPFAFDLSLTGAHSLHQLLDTTRSIGASERLLGWLLQPVPDLPVLQERQAVVQELLGLPGFRLHLAYQAGRALPEKQSHTRWDDKNLLQWLQTQTSQKDLRPFVLLLGALAALNITLVALQSWAGWPSYWVFSLIVYAAVYLYKYQEVSELFGRAYQIGASLQVFSSILTFLETYPYPLGSRLERLARPFRQAQTRPSQAIRRINTVISAASLQNNLIVWLALNALLPWDLLFAYQLQGVKARLMRELPAWLDSWYELEALSALANFARLNPDYTFPEVQTRQSASVFSARSLGHPLIPARQKRSNDCQIENLGELMLITGSNMSGKSTFLRTMGINLVLAYSGAPVDAAHLVTLPFRLFTCIQVSDSLDHGISYFYAEVRRLRALLDEIRLPHPFPVFFLIDEIFRGTNNRERQTGSRSYLQALVGSRSVGAVSTHDLDLVDLAHEIPAIKNFHFREEVEADRMVFDYRLREGPCPTTNALKIMELEGLPVQR